MTTNDKEYMRNYQRERRAKLSLQENVKIVKNKVKVTNEDGTPTSIDLSILRAFYKIFTNKSHRGPKEELISFIILYLRSELGK